MNGDKIAGNFIVNKCKSTTIIDITEYALNYHLQHKERFWKVVKSIIKA